MSSPYDILVKILKILTQNYNKNYTLAELTNAVAPICNLSDERKNQAKVLEVLILLNDINLVILNSDSDMSSFYINSIN